MHSNTRNAFALSILFALGAIAAPAQSSDTLTVTVRTAKINETVDIPLDQLKVGESRQLVAASGKPAVVTRNEHGVTVEVAGERREIALPDVESMHLHQHALNDHDVKLLHLDRHHGSDGDREVKKTVIMRHGDGDGEGAADAMSEAEIDALVAEAASEAGIASDDGKERIIVKRRIEKSGDDAATN